jgi:hypothetical protein
LKGIDVNFWPGIREVSIETKNVAVMNISANRRILQDPLLAARQALQRSPQLGIVWYRHERAIR